MHIVSTTEPVPVFDCHVLLRKPTAAGEPWQARCAAAPSVSATGSTERETLQSLVIRFKYFIQEYRQQSQPIPWVSPEQTPAADEVERWIPVHL